MTDKEMVEHIVREIAKSFSGEKSTQDWTDETIWFDAAPFACVGKNKAIAAFDNAFAQLQSLDVEILDMRTRIMDKAALVCSVQNWHLVMKNGDKLDLIMRQSNYLEKHNDKWQVLHEHTSNVPNWDGKIVE